ncbi:ZN474 protein, partial [Acromyrmex insinuator]
MKWKREPCEFLSQKTFLIIKDDLDISKDPTKTTNGKKAAAKNAARIGTWPPKMKRVKVFCEKEPERPKTANLTRPSVLDPALVNKLDMSLLSKELLCDSMTRFHQNGKLVSGGTTSSSSSSSLSLLLPSPPSVSRRRQSAVVNIATTTTWSSHDAPVRRQRRSFEQIYEPRVAAGLMEEIDRSRSLAVIATQESVSKRNSDIRRLDDNNNKNSPPKVLSMVKKKNSRAGLSNDLEIFTSTSKTTKSAPEPCKTCGRPDQPERFHSHPKGSQSKIKDIPSPMMKSKSTVLSVPKSIQKPVALNFRSDRNRNKLDEIENPVIPQDYSSQVSDQQSRSLSALMKRGPRSVTCYVCGREFGTASFPIHEPKCMEKWERENNLLAPSQRRPRPQKPAVGIEHNDWNAAAWEQSQEQLIPCAKCGRTFLPERLPVHERSCKATPKNNERLATPVNGRNAPPTVPCSICGRRFGTRSIKIHEPQCNRRWQAQNDVSQQEDPALYRQKSVNSGQGSSQSMYPNLSQKKTVTCYICGRDFGSSSIAIHEPQCLKKWHAENDKLSPARRRKEPQKPEIIYIRTIQSAMTTSLFAEDPSTGNMMVDQAATVEANWMTHLSQLVACKHCGRTFNPDRVNIHEKSCKGSR